MTMCFSLVIATTFVLTLFGLVPYLRRCISGQGVQGPALQGREYSLERLGILNWKKWCLYLLFTIYM